MKRSVELLVFLVPLERETLTAELQNSQSK